MGVPTNAGGQKFFDNSNLLRRIAQFQAEVAADPAKFSTGVLARFEVETVAYGRQQLSDMYRVLMVRDFPDGSVPSRVAGLLEANRNRYIELWQRNVQNGFASAASSVPGSTRLGTKSLLQRLSDFFLAKNQVQQKPPVVPARLRDKAELNGIVRTALVNGKRRVFRQRLAPYLKMLFRTYPMNFLRDHNMLVARSGIDPSDTSEEVFYIAAGRSQNSSPVCVQCQGRAMTRSAVRMAARDLQSPLFHPNCRHRSLTKAATVNSYDGSRGPLVTVKTVQSWIGQGKVKRAKRPNPVTVNV